MRKNIISQIINSFVKLLFKILRLNTDTCDVCGRMVRNRRVAPNCFIYSCAKHCRYWYSLSGRMYLKEYWSTNYWISYPVSLPYYRVYKRNTSVNFEIRVPVFPLLNLSSDKIEEKIKIYSFFS